jgi:hypothetical protein
MCVYVCEVSFLDCRPQCSLLKVMPGSTVVAIGSRITDGDDVCICGFHPHAFDNTAQTDASRGRDKSFGELIWTVWDRESKPLHRTTTQ